MNYLMEPTITIKLSDYGDRFGPRVLGIEIMQKVIDILNKDNETIVVFDFENIQVISTGFSKELFGGLLKYLGIDFRRRIKFRFSDNKELISSAILRGIKAV